MPEPKSIGKDENWWRREGFVFSGNWHPLPARIRAGGAIENDEEVYLREHSEESVLALKKKGIDLVIIHCDRGYPPEEQKEEVELARSFCALCHKHGMKVGAYVANTLYFESFYQERPEARDWVIKTADGRFANYGGEQTWRHVACFSSPGYRDYQKNEIIKTAIEYVGVDLLHFDNMAVWPEPDSCHCDHCKRRFRQFIEERYPTPAARKAHLGMSDFSGVEPPTFYMRFCPPWNLEQIKNPLMRDWVRFRCRLVADYFKEMCDYARSLKPNVLIDMNCGGIWGCNQSIVHGVEHNRVHRICDIFWDENPDNRGKKLGPNPDGTFYSLFRSFKLGRTLGKPVFHGVRDKLGLAESMALNPFPLGIFARLGYAEMRNRCHEDLSEDEQKYAAFLKKYGHMFLGARSAARVAVLRNFESLAFKMIDTHRSVVTIEQTLFQRRIPFDIILDDEMKDLAQYKCLVLANVEVLSDEHLDIVRKFVQDGGGLLVTENTGKENGRDRLRADFPFKEIFQSDTPPESVRSVRFGKGKATYLPKIEYATERKIEPLRGYNGVYRGIDVRYWKLPLNADEIIGAVKWLAPDSTMLEIAAPGGVICEPVINSEGKLLIHLVNFLSADRTLESIPVRFLDPVPKSIRILSPDGDGTDQTVRTSKCRDYSELILESLDAYTLLICD